MPVYRLVSEDVTNVGGPMGDNDSSENWTEYFESIDGAKAFAEKDYAKTERGRKEGPIKWREDGTRGWTSGDLSFVMYDITEVKIKKDKHVCVENGGCKSADCDK
jgi:hypothetical protein